MKNKKFFKRKKRQKLKNYFLIKQKSKISKVFKKRNSTIKKINFGIEFLRMILSLLVVLVHNFNYRNTKLQTFPIRNLPYYIPTFLIISFYFSFNTFASRNIEKMKQRFIRILFPYIGWPIIFWIRGIYLHYIYGRNENILLKNLFYQLLIGDGTYGIFWFLFNLIFCSFFFGIIILLFKQKYLFVLALVYLACYDFGHSKYHKKFLQLYNKPIRHSIGPIAKSFTYCFTGFFLRSINILKKYYKIRIVFMLLYGSILFIILHYNAITRIPSYFEGIFISLVAVSAFSFFAMIPFDIFENRIIIFFLKQISSYTGGVYYLHPKVSDIFNKYFISIRRRTFKGCLLLYIICYLICFIGANAFRKSNIKFLFY